MARYWCERCGAESNTLSEPHLCKDITKRLARRERQVATVLDIMRTHAPWRSHDEINQTIAEEIVQKLAQLGVQED